MRCQIVEWACVSIRWFLYIFMGVFVLFHVKVNNEIKAINRYIYFWLVVSTERQHQNPNCLSQYSTSICILCQPKLRCERKTAERYRRNTKFRLFGLMAFQVCFCRTEWNKTMVCESTATHPSNVWIDGVRAMHRMIHSSSRRIRRRWCDRLIHFDWKKMTAVKSDIHTIRYCFVATTMNDNSQSFYCMPQ